MSVTTISDGCYVQSHCVIYAGATLGERVICTDYCSVDTDAVIGHDSKLQYRASIHSRVIVGAGCRIGGFLCDDTRVGDRTSFYGETVHSYDHHGGDSDVSAPIIDSDVIVGFGAVLIGGIKIGQGAYIGAGAVVTQDVPVGAIVVGANRVSTRQDWPGKMSRRLPG
jgi:acetyltransferase-like isoleucine patch superfamily enzyme